MIQLEEKLMTPNTTMLLDSSADPSSTSLGIPVITASMLTKMIRRK